MVSEAPVSDAQLHDPHIGLHDRSASVSLNAVMQSTVPDPFGGNKNFSHLNMPGYLQLFNYKVEGKILMIFILL